MAATMDNQMPLHDDLNLMGLHELDTQLSLFESSVLRGESSTPDAMSNSPFGDFDQRSQTIIVDAPDEIYSSKMQYTSGSRARFVEQNFVNGIQYVPSSLLPYLQI
jgi:hypothetical protein